MKALLTFLAAAAFAGGAGCASHSALSPAPLPPRREPVLVLTKPLFWSLEKDGKVSHLLGTIHFGVDAEELPEWIFQKLALSTAFVSEADLTAITRASLLARVEEEKKKEAAATAAGVVAGPLDEKISPEAFQKLKELTRGKATEAQLRALTVRKAFGLVAILRTDGLVMTLRQHPELIKKKPMDLELQLAARDRHLELYFLESMTDLEANFAPLITAERLEKALLAPVRDTSGTIAQLAAAYRDGSPEKIETHLKALDPEALAAMFGKRNEHWVRELSELHKVHGPLFIAVGAGHMAHADGSLLDLLTKAGFNVKRQTGP